MNDKKLIMLVDDDKTCNFLNSRLIKNWYPTFEIADFIGAEEALQYMESAASTRKIDVILLDINMPEIDGWDFLEEFKLKKYTHFDKIVMLSSSIDESDMERAKTYAEVNGFITKPLTFGQFSSFVS